MPTGSSWAGRYWKGQDMALTELQKKVLSVIAANRSEESYLAGGAVLNMDWPRMSDDLDIFHPSDEAIPNSAHADIDSLRAAGFTVSIDIEIYGVFECTVSDGRASTMIQWMSASSIRFFPLINDFEWGVRLHPADLAVNKVLAASSRQKARDIVDLAFIAERYCPLGPLVMAAASKPPHFSPERTIDQIVYNSLSILDEQLISIRGLPEDMDAHAIRETIRAALDQARSYVQRVNPDLIGLLTLDAGGRPTEAGDSGREWRETRRATAEPEAFPDFPESEAGRGFGP